MTTKAHFVMLALVLSGTHSTLKHGNFTWNNWLFVAGNTPTQREERQSDRLEEDWSWSEEHWVSDPDSCCDACHPARTWWIRVSQGRKFLSLGFCYEINLSGLYYLVCYNAWPDEKAGLWGNTMKVHISTHLSFWHPTMTSLYFISGGTALM